MERPLNLAEGTPTSRQGHKALDLQKIVFKKKNSTNCNSLFFELVRENNNFYLYPFVAHRRVGATLRAVCRLTYTRESHCVTIKVNVPRGRRYNVLYVSAILTGKLLSRFQHRDGRDGAREIPRGRANRQAQVRDSTLRLRRPLTTSWKCPHSFAATRILRVQ